MGFGLQKFDLSSITRNLELPSISSDKLKPLTLIVTLCGNGNTRYENEMFRRDAAKRSAVDAALPPSPPPALSQSEREAAARAALASTRRENSEIVAATSIVGWLNIYNDANPEAPAEFTAEAALAFLHELAERCSDVHTEVVQYVTTRRNFRDGRSRRARWEKSNRLASMARSQRGLAARPASDG